MRGIRTPRLLVVRNYLNNYFSHVYMSDAIPYMCEIRIPRLLGVRVYLNDYFGMYRRLTCSHIYVELAIPTNLWLGII